MPSYKDKYEYIRTHQEIMERRVLLDEIVLSDLKDRIDALTIEKENAVEREKISDYQKNQLYLALVEIEELVLSQKLTPPDLAMRTTQEVFETVVESLHRITKNLRDSNVRANTILENITGFPKGKLLKRERKEQIREQMTQSRAASRNASVSSFQDRQEMDPELPQLRSPPRLFDRNRSGSASSSRTSGKK